MDLHSKIKFPKSILFREIDGEAVLLNVQTGVYFGMDKTGTALWKIFRKEKKLAPALDHLLENFEIDPETGEADILDFALKLKKNNLITLENA